MTEISIEDAWARIKDIIDEAAVCRDFDELDGIAISRIDNVIKTIIESGILI